MIVFRVFPMNIPDEPRQLEEYINLFIDHEGIFLHPYLQSFLCNYV